MGCEIEGVARTDTPDAQRLVTAVNRIGIAQQVAQHERSSQPRTAEIEGFEKRGVEREGVAEALGVVVGEAVDFLEEGAQRFRVAVGQVGVLEDVAEERSGKVRFVKVNTEAERELSARFGIRSIPTIMIFRKGEIVDMLNGAVPKAPFDSWLNESL